MADANLDQSTRDENNSRQAFGEEWYQERWAEAASDPVTTENLAKTESLIDAARGVARILTADVNALDFNSECQGSELPTLTSQDRGALSIALVTLLSDASMQMAKSRRD